MSFMQKLRVMLGRFMSGRNGVDNLGYTSLWLGLLLNVLDLINQTGILSLLGLVLYGYAIFRMMSRNVSKRTEENRRYVEWKDNISIKVKQFFIRLKNIRVYKYFRCPKCKSLMRLPRGCGEKTMTCPRCHTTFHQKA